MKKNKKNIIICGGLIALAVVYTILVKYIDVQVIGPKESSVGFATINKFVFNLTGVNMIFYHITDWLGFIPLFIAFIYAMIGLFQMIKRRSLFKVDKEIIGLGIFYVGVIGLYIFFETYIINYRPILMDGTLEASYPSSHTLLSICICGSSLMINKILYNNKKIFKLENIISILSIFIIVIGRLISGVHWFTDIIGAVLISIALLKILKIYFNSIRK
ncbi:MAG: phosphatase PAP2 family protein [Candidatus Coprovivens sp.]|nr:phosphatase PAP2 family protein [Mycoplasmatota bacterium]